MALFGSLLTLAGSLIGAKKQSDARKRSDWMNSPQGIRANAEEAGFNPRVFAGPGTGTGAQYAPTMGSTIANGFALASDQLQEQQALKRQKTELEQENRRLEKVVQATTLTPKVPGVYGNAAPSKSTQQYRNIGTTGGNGSARDGLGASAYERPRNTGGPAPVPRDSGLKVGGLPWDTNPYFSDSEAFENRYGEPGEWVAGAVNGVADGVWNAANAYKKYLGDPSARLTRRAYEGAKKWFEGEPELPSMIEPKKQKRGDRRKRRAN